MNLFAWIWRKWLWNDFSQRPNRVIRITGWRSCLYDTPSGQRTHATFLIWPWEKRNQWRHPRGEVR